MADFLQKNYTIKTDKLVDPYKPSFTVSFQNLSGTYVTIRGDMFQYTTLNGLYLSSNNPSMSSIELDLYTEIKSISARYPKVYGFPVYEYDVLDNGTLLQFKLPENLLAGNYDILYFNGAGYAKASNTKRFTFFTVVSGIKSTPVPTISQTPTPTVTITSTPTITPTNTITLTPSLTPTKTPTPTVTSSVTPTITPSITPTETPTSTVTPTITPTNTPTSTVTPTPTLTPTVTITQTPTVTVTPTTSPIPSQLFYAWYDASDSSTVTTSVNNITEWRDKSGSNNHLTPATAIYPTYNTRTQNGLNVINFPTQGAYIKKTSATIQNNSQTWFIVCQVDNTYGNGASIASLTTLDGNQSSWQIYAYDNSCFIGALARSIGGTSIIIEYQPPSPIGTCLNGTYQMFEIVFDRSSQTTSTYLNGVLKNTKSDTVPFILNGGEIKFFSNRSASQFCTGAIAEIICIGSTSSTDRASIQNYLTQKWMI